MLNQIHHSSSPPKKTFAKGCVALFGLPFCIPGLLIALWIGWMNWQVVRQSGWEEVEVRVLQVPEGVDDLTDEQKGLHYRYDARGDSFTIRNSAPHLPSMSDEDQRAALQSTARAAMQGRGSMTCWVNPAQPEEHTLILARPAILQYFLGIFTFSHGLLGFLLLMSQWRPEPDTALVERSGQSSSSYKDRRRTILLAVLLSLNAFTIPSALSLWLWFSENNQITETSGNLFTSGIPMWLVVIVLALSILPLRWWRRHTKAVRLNHPLLLSHPTSADAFRQPFRLSLSHVEPGQELPYEVQTATEWKLECRRQDHGTDSDGDRVTREKVLRSVPLQAMAQGGGFLRLSGEDAIPERIGADVFRLDVEGKTTGGLRIGPFQIAMSGEEVEASEKVAASSPAETAEQLEAEKILHRKNLDGSESWDFPSDKFAKGARVLLIVGILLLVADVSIMLFLAFGMGFEPAGFFVLGLSFAAAMMFFVHHQVSAQRSIRISSEGLEARTQGWYAKRQTLHPLQSIVSIEATTKASVNSQPYYHIQLTSIDNAGRSRHAMISGFITDERAAHSLALQLRQAVARFGWKLGD